MFSHLNWRNCLLSVALSGVYADVFDPVTKHQIRYCLDLLSRGDCKNIFLVLLPGGGPFPSSFTPYEDRWRMLSAAGACDKRLVPVSLPERLNGSGLEDILQYLTELYPKEDFCPVDSGFRPETGPLFPGRVCPAVEEYCNLLGLYGQHSAFPEARNWNSLLFNELNPHRYAHSLAVAWTAKHLAALYGIDEHLAEEAGLLHDCAKCLPLTEMQKIAAEHRVTNDPLFLESGALLHSLVGAEVAREKYGIKDSDILEAIAYHNTGFPGMSSLAMCVCLADFIEPNRDPFPGLEETRAMAEHSLEKALLMSLEATIRHVCSKGKKLHPRTMNTAAWLKTLPAVKKNKKRKD